MTNAIMHGLMDQAAPPPHQTMGNPSPMLTRRKITILEESRTLRESNGTRYHLTRSESVVISRYGDNGDAMIDSASGE
jgi:hypothetical protein